MEDKKVLVFGVFGDSWLSSLYGSAIGPSPAPYKMQGDLMEEYPDGSALIQGKISIWDGMVNFHDDNTACRSYPCNKNHTRRYEREYKNTACIVPFGFWESR